MYIYIYYIIYTVITSLYVYIYINTTCIYMQCHEDIFEKTLACNLPSILNPQTSSKDPWHAATRWHPKLSQLVYDSNKNLVGGMPTPLKKMKVTWDDDIPNIWKNKQCSKPQILLDRVQGGTPVGNYVGLQLALTLLFSRYIELIGGHHLVHFSTSSQEFRKKCSKRRGILMITHTARTCQGAQETFWFQYIIMNVVDIT